MAYDKPTPTDQDNDTKKQKEAKEVVITKETTAITPPVTQLSIAKIDPSFAGVLLKENNGTFDLVMWYKEDQKEMILKAFDGMYDKHITSDEYPNWLESIITEKKRANFLLGV